MKGGLMRFLKNQKIIAILGFLIITGLIFFPTWKISYGGNNIKNVRACLYSNGGNVIVKAYKTLGKGKIPPELLRQKIEVDYNRMTVEVLYIIFLCGVLIYFFNHKKDI